MLTDSAFVRKGATIAGQPLSGLVDPRRALELFLQDSDVRMRLARGASLGVDRRFSIDTYSSGIRTLIGQICPLPSPAEP